MDIRDKIKRNTEAILKANAMFLGTSRALAAIDAADMSAGLMGKFDTTTMRELFDVAMYASVLLLDMAQIPEAEQYEMCDNIAREEATLYSLANQL